MPTYFFYMSQFIPAIHHKTESKLKEENAKAEFPSVTTDIWTSRANRSFMSLTIRYCDKNFAIVQRQLTIEHFPGTHTGVSIKAQLGRMLDKWQVTTPEGLPLFVTVDHGTNI